MVKRTTDLKILLTHRGRHGIISFNKYKTVLNGSSNVWETMTETCWWLRSRMESRREVVQELLPERISLVDAAGRQPLPCQALHGLSRRCWKSGHYDNESGTAE